MPQTPSPATDATRCPLCGGDNRCAMELEKASGQAQPPCWCMEQVFSPELLARIPAQARGLACLCQRCARAALATPSGSPA